MRLGKQNNAQEENRGKKSNCMSLSFSQLSSLDCCCYCVCCCFVIINSNNFNFSPSLPPTHPDPSGNIFSFPPTTHNSAATRNDCRFSLHRHRRRRRYSSYTHSPCPPTKQQKTSTSHLTPPSIVQQVMASSHMN